MTSFYTHSIFYYYQYYFFLRFNVQNFSFFFTSSNGGRDAKRKNKRDGRLSRLRLRIQSQSGNGASAIRSLKGENFAVFFHMATLDHTLPDLIWNQNTKTELR